MGVKNHMRKLHSVPVAYSLRPLSMTFLIPSQFGFFIPRLRSPRAGSGPEFIEGRIGLGFLIESAVSASKCDFAMHRSELKFARSLINERRMIRVGLLLLTLALFRRLGGFARFNSGVTF